MLVRSVTLIIACLLLASSSWAQITISRGSNMSVDASHDGRLAIDLRGELWVVPGGGGDAKQLTSEVKSVQRPRWSPDARKITYHANAEGKRGIWIYDLDSGATQILSEGPGFDLYPDWHPDGDRIIFSSGAPNAGFDLWEIDVPTRVRWRVSDRPGDETEPAWSASGRDLVYVHRDTDRWSLILRRHSQPEEILLTTADKLAAPSWRPDGSLISYFRTGSAGTTIEMVILSSPRLVRTYANSEQFVIAPLSWQDRFQIYYSANDEIRQRQFDAWGSRPLRFRATIQPPKPRKLRSVRSTLSWPNEPAGELVIHAERMFDGVSDDYQFNKDITIKGGRIAAIEDHANRPGSIVIDLGDLAVIPGFIDADARLPGDLAVSHGPDILTSGVTTIVGAHPKADEFNELWSGKEIPGPRLLQTAQWGIGPLSRPELDVTAAIVSSNSTGLPTGAALSTQIRAMQIAGLTPEQTLRAMGVNAAGAMQADPYLGRIAVGAAADLVFVDGDPLANSDAASNVVAVVRNGRFYSVSGLIDRAKTAETVD